MLAWTENLNVYIIIINQGVTLPPTQSRLVPPYHDVIGYIVLFFFLVLVWRPNSHWLHWNQ